MTTYGQFYNPKQPDNRLKYLIVGLAIGLAASILFAGCNSVKKTTDINISKADSSSTFKTDSSSVQKNDVTTETQSKKEWDKETVIEFQSWPFALIGGMSKAAIDSINLAYSEHNGTTTPWVIIQDGKITVHNKPIKSITTRSKGKDTSSTKTVDKSEIATETNKEGKTELKTFDKDKTKGKETKRTSPIIFIALGVVLIASVFFYFLFKRK